MQASQPATIQTYTSTSLQTPKEINPQNKTPPAPLCKGESKSKITQNYPKIIYTGQQLKTIINNY